MPSIYVLNNCRLQHNNGGDDYINVHYTDRSSQSKLLYLLLGNKLLLPNTKRKLSPHTYWEEECCLRAIQSFPFLSTASLHFLLFPQLPTPPCINNPSVPSGYSAETIGTGLSEQYYQICTNATRRVNVGQAHSPLPYSSIFLPATTMQEWTSGSDSPGG